MSDLFGNHIVGFPTRGLKCQFVIFFVIFFQEQECFLEELRKAQRRLLKVSRDRRQENWYSLILSRSDTNWAVQSQKLAKCLKFWI